MTYLNGEGDRLGNVQEIEVWPCEQNVYAQPIIRPVEWDVNISLGFWDTNESPNLGQTTWLCDSHPTKKKKKKKIPNT